MSSPIALLVAALLNGWMGADLELRADCLEVTSVWLGGPAASGGLEQGDCLTNVTIDGRALPLVNALEQIVEAGGGSVLRAQAAKGRPVLVTLTAPKRETLIAYCEWRQGRRIKLNVVFFSGGDATLSELEFEVPPSIQEVRKRIGATGAPRVDLKADCAFKPRKVVGRVTDALIITSDATVSFGEPPQSMFVIQADGGTCQLPAPPYLSDGGLDFDAAETECKAAR